MQRLFYCAAVLGLIVAIPAAAQERGTGTPGAIPQYVPPAISQKPSTPPLKLSQAQREKIARAVSSQDTEVSSRSSRPKLRRISSLRSARKFRAG